MTINDYPQDIWVDDIIEIIELGSFHHVAGTYDGKMMKLYWDGAIVGSLLVDGPVARDNGVYLSSEGNPLRGALDEVAIYDRALTGTEIADIYSNNSSPVPAPASDGATSQPSGALMPYANSSIYAAGESINAFSPAVYLLDLLDFVKKNIC